jgi:hypothetical protein
MTRDPRLVTDIDLEPTPASDEWRVLALLESRFRQRVPVYDVDHAGRLQYSARLHSLRHIHGYVILNGEDGRTPEGRKKTWFVLIGRLTRIQLASLEDLCRAGTRYSNAIAQVFPEATAYMKPQDREKRKLVRDYPTVPQIATVAPASVPSLFSSQELERTAKWEDAG